MIKVIYGNGFEKKNVSDLGNLGKAAVFVCVLFPVCFALAKLYPFPSNPFSSA